MIVYFSGTGNSEAVAAILSKHLKEQAIKITEANIPAECSHIIWVFPIYGWRVPAIIREAIDKLSHNKVNIMVTTCGDDIGKATQQFKKLIAKSGGLFGGAYTVTMPDSYVFLPGFDIDSIELTKSKLEAMPKRVRHIADCILSGEIITDVDEGAIPRIKSYVLGKLFEMTLMSPRGFKSNQKLCNGCGKCVQACPLHNITIIDGHPQWSNNCAFCTACYHACPQHAISHGLFSAKKGQYNFKKNIRFIHES